MQWQSVVALAIIAVIYVFAAGYAVGSVDRFWMKALLVIGYVGAFVLVVLVAPSTL
ncbi:MAG: hypothetical protein WC054_00385 [Candidatus Nanopelagicales bacterium]